MRRIGFLVAFVGLACLAGCGSTGANVSNVVQVSGKAVAPDGKAAKHLTLNFVPTTPGGATAYGVVGEDGTFTPKTLNNQAGIVPGTYKVVVDPMPKGTKVSAACTAENTTELRVEVGSGSSELVVQLK